MRLFTTVILTVLAAGSWGMPLSPGAFSVDAGAGEVSIPSSSSSPDSSPPPPSPARDDTLGLLAPPPSHTQLNLVDIDARQSRTNVSGLPVNLTETPPFQITLSTDAATSTSTATVRTVTAPAATTAASDAVGNERPNANAAAKSLQQEVADGGGQFSFPTKSDIWTMLEPSVVRWTALNYTLDVWLTNSDPAVLSDDALLATVPPGTFVLVTEVPSNAKAGQNYSLYLTPAGNKSYVISRSDPFVVRTLVKALFNAAPRMAVPPTVAASVLALAMVAMTTGLGLAG